MAITFESRVMGCWLGKSIGGTLGLPAEGRTERLDFTFYNPIPTVAPPNDDLELQLVWLDLLEKRGFNLTQQDFADAWSAHIHYMWDEYGICRWNLRRGVSVSAVGTFENRFHDGMGSPIRSEIWACLAAERTDLAASYAALDASLDHGAEGIAGEVFFAVMQNLVLNGASIREAYDGGLAAIAPETAIADALRLVLDDYQNGVEEWAARDHLIEAHGSPNFTHAPLNVGLTMWALLYGEADFEKTVLLAVNGGYDTDCTAATAGATLGLLLGDEAIPARWSQPIGNGVFVGAGIIGIDVAATLEDLSARTIKLARALIESGATPESLPVPASTNLAQLPGTIKLQPLDGSPSVLWANGELPDEVKRAGGATWVWTPRHNEPYPFRIVNLAQVGANLFLDGDLISACPAGLPYVPATHRCNHLAIVQVPAPYNQPQHHMRLELASTDTVPRASVILTRYDYHIEPWTGELLPHEPEVLEKPAR